MEKKKSAKISLSTYLLILAIMAMIIMGLFIYNLINDKRAEVQKSTELQSQVNSLNKTVSDLQGKIDTISDTINDTNIVKTDTSSSGNEVEKNSTNSFKISYKEEIYSSTKENGELSHQNKRNLPIIKNSINQPAASKIEKSLTQISDKNWSTIKQSSDEYKENSYIEGVNYMLNTHFMSDNCIVFRANQSGGFGGVSWISEELYNYDTKTGDILSLNNVTTDYNSLLSKIISKTEKYIKDNSIELLEEAETNLNAEIKKIVEQNGNWGFSNDGMEFIFPKYSISSGATGIITIKLDKNEINPYLLEVYKIKD